MQDNRYIVHPSSRTRRTAGKEAVSSIITTIIITGVLLIILVIASFVSANILELQVASTEFEQAKSSMLLLDDIVHDVSMRPGSGGYTQFNERTGGVGIAQQSESVTLQVYMTQTSVTLNPDNAGTYSEWIPSNTMVNRWNLTNDNDDHTYIMTGTQGARELQRFDNATQFTSPINNMTFEIWASSPDTSQNKINVMLRSHGIDYLDSTALYVRKDAGGNNPGLIQVTYSKNPMTNNAWTWNDINSLEIGCSASLISAGRVQVSKWDMVVDFTPAGAQAINILNGSYLFNRLVYSGGSLATAAETKLRGTNSTIVDAAQGLGFLRVEQDNGTRIKLDYDRIRIDDEALIDATTAMVQITLINLTKGIMGGSGTVNVRLQNLETVSTPYIVPSSSITLKLVWTTAQGTVTRSFAFVVPSATVSRTVVMFTKISVQVSTA